MSLTTWVVYGYKLQEVTHEVSALTYTDALEEAQSEGIIKPYDAQQKEYEVSSTDEGE